MINHVLLEVFCLKNSMYDELKLPPACENCDGPRYECLFNKCPYVSFTSHENALCYVNDSSYTDEIISFSEDMVPEGISEPLALDLWRAISIKKIEEAHIEYITRVNELAKDTE